MASAPKSTSQASGIPGARVERHLDVAVVGEGGVGDLDDEEDVAGARVAGVAIGPTFEHGHVRLRRVVTPEYHGVLHVESSPSPAEPGRRGRSGVDAACVGPADGVIATTWPAMSSTRSSSPSTPNSASRW